MQSIQLKHGIHLLSIMHPDGYIAREHFGLVSGEAVFGANFVKDFFAKVGDFTGGRINSYENVVRAAKEKAALVMSLKAAKLGANAVVGVDIKVLSISSRLITASCVGTAVLLEKI